MSRDEKPRAQTRKDGQDIIMTEKQDDVLVVHKDEAARLTGLSIASIDRAIARGELKTKKYGKRTLIMKTELSRFLNALPDQPLSKAKQRKTEWPSGG